MSEERQKSQMRLAFMEGSKSEARQPSEKGPKHA